MVTDSYDLTAIRDELKKDSKYREINLNIGRYAALQSVARDLDEAEDAIALIAEIDKETGQERSTFGRPLMAHAVMVYCRATIEDGNGRLKIDSIRAFSPEQLDKHKDIVKLRNKCIAHFDVGKGRYGDGWIDERVIFQAHEAGTRVRPVWVRTNYLAQLLMDMQELIWVARETVSEETTRCGKELLDAISSHADDTEFRAIVETAKFDALAFFGDPQSAAEFQQQGRFDAEIYQPKIISGKHAVDAGGKLTTRISDP